MKLAPALIGLLLAVPVPALAKCGTAQLNGNWVMTVSATDNMLGGVISITNVKIADGQLQTVDGTGLNVIAQTASCKVTLGGSSGAVGWSEYLPTTSTRKPNVLQVASEAWGQSVQLLRR